MKLEQKLWRENGFIESTSQPERCENPQIIFLFGSGELLRQNKCIKFLKEKYKKAKLIGCSTAGEICGTDVYDDTIAVTMVEFEKTAVKGYYTEVKAPEDSFNSGKKLADRIDKNELAHVFVLSCGLNINGSQLVKGMIENLPKNVSVTGALAGDGPRFQKTYVIEKDNVKENLISALGIYGKNIKIGYGSIGGWDSFGPERLVTKSNANVLYELDREPALDLYKKYLGEYAAGLPSSGLLFPLSIRAEDNRESIVRTILSINEKEKSLTFAGDIPEGSYARLMRANFDRLIDGAGNAAKETYRNIGLFNPELAILISCVGRRLILKQRIEEEVEAVKEVLGEKCVITGFYSYGEIAPSIVTGKCELHNQTMTITAFKEN